MTATGDRPGDRGARPQAARRLQHHAGLRAAGRRPEHDRRRRRQRPVDAARPQRSGRLPVGDPPTWHRQVMAAVLEPPGVGGLGPRRRAPPRAGRLPTGATGAHRAAGGSPTQPVRDGPPVRPGVLDRRLGPFPVVTVEQALCDTAGRLGPTGSRPWSRRPSSPDAPSAGARARSMPRRSCPARHAGCPTLVAIAPAMLADRRRADVGPRGAAVPDPRATRGSRTGRPQATPPWWPTADERLDVLIPCVAADRRGRRTAVAHHGGGTSSATVGATTSRSCTATARVRFTHQQLAPRARVRARASCCAIGAHAELAALAEAEHARKPDVCASRRGWRASVRRRPRIRRCAASGRRRQRRGRRGWGRGRLA